MKKEDAIEKLKRQIGLIDNLKSQPIFSSDFTKWRRDTKKLIERIFGSDTENIKEFKNISYSLHGTIQGGNPEFLEKKIFIERLDYSCTILESMIQEIVDYWDDHNTNEPIIPALDNIKILCDRFDLVTRQIQIRHDKGKRTTIEINDEYDVQDLFHALLTLYFDDIREEEYTPSYAGGASRVDFLLKEEQTVIELKKTREKLTDKEVGEQLIIDIARYKSHSDCKTLICFVYDPERRIKNPRGLENDLSKTTDGMIVQVFIRPI